MREKCSYITTPPNRQEVERSGRAMGYGTNNFGIGLWMFFLERRLEDKTVPLAVSARESVIYFSFFPLRALL